MYKVHSTPIPKKSNEEYRYNINILLSEPYLALFHHMVTFLTLSDL